MKIEKATREYLLFSLLLVLLHSQPLSLSTGSDRCSDQPMDGGRGRRPNDGSGHRRVQTNMQSWTHRSPSFALNVESAEKKKEGGGLYENKQKASRISTDQWPVAQRKESVCWARVCPFGVLGVVSIHRLDALVPAKWHFKGRRVFISFWALFSCSQLAAAFN